MENTGSVERNDEFFTEKPYLVGSEPSRKSSTGWGWMERIMAMDGKNNGRRVSRIVY